MSTTTTTDSSTVRIKKALVAKGIKLWKPPYYGVAGAASAVQELAATLLLADESISSLTTTTIEQPSFMLTEIRQFQEHALEKLRSKGKLLQDVEIKIPAGIPADAAAVLPLVGSSAMLAEHVETSSNRKILTLRRVNPDLTVAQFHQQLVELLLLHATTTTGGGAGSIKLVCQGKSLGSNDVARRLSDALLDAHSSSSSNSKGTSTARLLCLIVPVRAASTATTANHDVVSPTTNTNNNNSTSANPEDEALVESICQAASQLAQHEAAAAGFDVTDAQGNLVSMTSDERIAFLKALGLHAMGKKRMQQQSESQNNYESSLLFLLQADQEWNRLDASWLSRVDNYGRLQLDIGWVYLKLERLENLENTTERLHRAEVVLKKQVHSNFLTLALVQAEQNNPVPAISFLFVRLFLLQSIAFHYQGNRDHIAKERFDWAAALASSLRNVSPPERVAQLCEVTKATPSQAISALRRTNGDLNRAAELATTDNENAVTTEKNRKKQTRLGRCENGQDFVDLGIMSQLQSALDLNGNQLVASGLLRLSNNQLDRAIDLYQEWNRDHTAILHRVWELDQRQGVSPAISRKRGRIDDPPEPDELAVAQLVSMGVEAAQARNALRRNRNNVELALVWLTTTTTTNRSDTASRRAGGRQQSRTTSSTEEGASLNGDAGATAVSPETVVANPEHHTDSEDRDEVDMEDGDGDEEEEENASEEEEAVDLLERVLGEVLQDQNQATDENLGESLDDEWSYIEKFRSEMN